MTYIHHHGWDDRDDQTGDDRDHQTFVMFISSGQLLQITKDMHNAPMVTSLLNHSRK